jgi:tryptophanyl-tRNA synthetase
MRARYESLIADPAGIEATLLAGAQKARAIAAPLMTRLRAAVGLRRLENGEGGGKNVRRQDGSGGTKAAVPVFKQYRERDGKFYFKLVGPQGRTLMQSRAFDSPKEVAEVIAAFQASGGAALATQRDSLQEPPALDAEELVPALDRLLASD